jgi:hypothetical protein
MYKCKSRQKPPKLRPKQPLLKPLPKLRLRKQQTLQQCRMLL